MRRCVRGTAGATKDASRSVLIRTGAFREHVSREIDATFRRSFAVYRITSYCRDDDGHCVCAAQRDTSTRGVGGEVTALQHTRVCADAQRGCRRGLACVPCARASRKRCILTRGRTRGRYAKESATIFVVGAKVCERELSHQTRVYTCARKDADTHRNIIIQMPTYTYACTSALERARAHTN